MSDLSDEAFSRILAMAREERYAYSVETIAASGKMWWLLEGSRYAIQKTPDGGRHIHFWPHRTLAENAAQGPWLNHTARPVELDYFYRVLFPDLLQTEDRLVFCFVEGKGFLSVTAEKFDEDVRSSGSVAPAK